MKIYLVFNLLLLTCLLGLAWCEQEEKDLIKPSSKFRILKPPVLGRAASKSYLIYSERATYFDAERLCRAVGWELVKVDNNIKQMEVEQYVLSDPYVDPYIWIDGQFWYGIWYFNNGDNLTYKNFYNGYDDSYTPSPSCLSVSTAHNQGPPIFKFKWIDSHCNNLQHFACEK